MTNNVPLDGEPLLTIQDLAYTFPDGTQALHNINSTINQGTFVTIIGPSGVGKSTLLRLIANLRQPTSGQIVWHTPPPHPPPLGLVFQNNNLMPWRTAADNIRLPLELAGTPSTTIKKRVAELLDLVGLTDFATSYPAQLSGGMAQRIAIARALIHQPNLLLLDEPFGALDALTRERMAAELLHIWRAHPAVTAIMVTHSINEAVLLADTVLVLNADSHGRGGTITSHHPIPLPRPRQQTLETSPTFHACAQQLRQSLKLTPHRR
ncbi:MAG TPA: ABC transporter ATP-binding protein [Anaerolineae bacterium]|nr:ABC transporter ATP-binding protein [Anaerolineae bacterium]